MPDQRQLWIGAALVVIGGAAVFFLLQNQGVSTYGDLRDGGAATDIPCSTDRDCPAGRMCALFSGEGVCVTETTSEQLCTLYDCPDGELCVTVPADTPAVACMKAAE